MEMAAVTSNNNHDYHDLHVAARKGSISDLRRYITKDNVDVLNNDEETALHLAAEFGHLECVTLLLAYGAKQKVDSRGCTPLHSAAMSQFPNATIARLLVQAATQQGDNFQQLLNKQTNDGYEKNTALHVAAGNLNVTAEFINELKDIDPRIHNSDGDTAFHVAAKSSNLQIIIYLLSTFRPIRTGWSVDDVDENRSEKAPTLLSMCAMSGNAEAVALLIQHGADVSKGVLHEIVVASVKKPEMVDKSLDVYQAVVDNAVTWRCLQDNRKCFIRGSTKYNEILRETVIYLTTKPFTDGKNMIQRAIELGASEMIFAIVNTDNVYKFDDFEVERNVLRQVKCSNTRYDVTDFTRLSSRPRTTVDRNPIVERGPLLSEFRDMEQSFKNPHHPKIPYLEELLLYEEEWKNKNIFNMPPFRELTKPYFKLLCFCYIILSIIQVIFVHNFYIHYTSKDTLAITFGSTSHRRYTWLLNGTLSDSAAAQERGYPSWVWLIWPVIFFGCSTIRFFIRSYRYKGKDILSDIILPDIVRIYDCQIPRTTITLLMAAVNSFHKIAYFVSLFIWFQLHKFARDDRHGYLKALSMAILFGSIVMFEFMLSALSHFHVFFIVLNEVIVHDIFLIVCFFCVFYFTTVCFAPSLYVLGMYVESWKDVSMSDINEYLLNSVVRIVLRIDDSLFDEPEIELSEHIFLFRVVFAFYVCFTVVILLTILTAVINNRYEDAKRRAESVWKFKMINTAFITAFMLRKVSWYLQLFTHIHCDILDRDLSIYLYLFDNVYEDRDNPGRFFVKVSQSKADREDRQKKLFLLYTRSS